MRGVCDDGYEGTGACTCLDAFNGTACEFCANSNMYGKNCSLECKCIHGTCNNGREGDGSCECFDGYMGKLCDKEIPDCDNVTCAEDAKCVMIGWNATCVCDEGFEKSESEGCIAIDACLSSPCDENAVCESTGPNLHKCTCQRGYRGDGLYCQSINRCQENHGGCVLNTSTCVYEGPGQHECVCIRGYEQYLPDVGCSMIDMCDQIPKPCHENANCQTVEPGNFECVCQPGFIGDGKLCYGNILQVLEEMNLNNTDSVAGGSLNKAIWLFKTFFKDLVTEHGPLTLFVPIDSGFRGSSVNLRDRARQIVFQHIIVGELQIQDLANNTVFYTLQGSSAELQARGSSFRFKLHGRREKARILKGDVVASNGMIHIINSLMTSQPAQIGSKSKDLFDLINSEGRHNRFVTLIRAADMEGWLKTRNLTIFTPSNGAWSSLPEGSLDYLQSPKGKDRLISLLLGHIFLGVVRVTDIINLKRLKSLDGSSVTIDVSSVGKIMLNGAARISQSDIHGKNGVYHHIDAVLLPEGVTSVIPNRCDKSISRIVKGPCGPCRGTLKCPGSTDVALNETATGCTYWVKTGARYIGLRGCARMCNRTFVTPQCCPDFYGRKCKPCPGAFKQICSGHGSCMDGYSFDGKCICDKEFAGVACQVCSNPKMFGANCSQECTCLYGNCDNGPSGRGKCKPDSCADGYWGENCEIKENVCGKRAIACHAHSVCVKDSTRVSCVCKPGYEGNGVSCKEIDPCLLHDRGGCHPQATCKKTGPGMHQCTCDDGWIGDGTYYCYRSTPCYNSVLCHNNATCQAVEGEYVCVCNKDFQGNGTYCFSTDPCTENNGGCHSKATCTSLGFGRANCTCPENFGGDGRHCYSTIAVEVTEYPELSKLADLFSAIEPEDNVLSLINGSYTLFAPNNDAITTFKTKAPADFWDNEGNILLLQGYHMLRGSYTIQRLRQLTELMNKVNTMADGLSANVSVSNNKEVFVNDARVVQADIPAINGYIHVIDKFLEPYPVSVDQPSLEEFFEVHPEFSLFAEGLMKTGLFNQVDNMDAYTLFVPTNSYLQTNGISIQTARFLSLFIVPQLLMSTTISNGQMADTILGSHDKIQFSKTNGNIFVNEVLITHTDMPTEGGVIHQIDGIIRSTVRHCDVKTKKTSYGTCVSCQKSLEASVCPLGYTRSASTYIRTDCTFTVKGEDGSESKYLGCQSWCTKITFTAGCCSGYYEPDCEECPGGANRPCSNQGICTSRGTCDCHDRFAGSTCDRCAQGWTGKNCSIDTTSCEYNNGGCSPDAVCSKVDSTITCVCKPGYVGVDGTDCHQPCAYYNGGCHPNAKCIYQNNNVTCECPKGFNGDGKKTCDINENMCKMESGPCTPEKYCSQISLTGKDTTDGNGTVMCTCKDNYQGNMTGTFCVNRSLLEAMKSIPATKTFYQELTDKTWSSERQDIIDQLKGMDRNITVFLPIDSNLKGYKLTTEDIRNHIINRSVLVEPSWWYDNGNEFETAAGQRIVIRDLSGYTVNGISVLKRNLHTANGIVHIIAQPLWISEPPPTTEPAISTTLDVGVPVSVKTTRSKKNIVLPVVGAVLGVVILAAIAIVAVWVWKGKATGFMQLRKRFRKGSDNSLSLARIHSEQDEDLDPLESPQVKKYNNPLYNVKDDYDNLDD